MAAPPIISARDLAVSFGGPPLFAGIELHLSRGDRAALVGRNGCGKTTLMRVLIGAIERDKGELYLEPGLKTVWQEQEPFFESAMTVADYVADGKHAGFEVDAILEDVALAGGRTLGTLSGGEGRRAQLARAFVAEPDLLLLDEPTNHLDLATIEWLERRLTAFKGAVMTISHDRAFLSNVTNRVLWLERGKLRVADRGFAHFEEWREETLRMEERALEKIDVHLAEETRWLLRGVTARRRRNQGRLARLEVARAQRAAMVGGRRRKLKLDAQEGDSRAKLVIEAKAITQAVPAADGAGERALFRDFSLLVVRGDKIGIVGPNGAGKTTLLRTLTGEIAPQSGAVEVARQLRVATFDQKREQLPPKATLRDVLCPGGGNAVAVRGQNRDVRAYLKDFLFDPRQADSPVATLSGGERNRLLLAKNLATPADLMILDEPTNDLDTDTLDLLIDLLGEFEGTLLVVSHDRDFLDQVVASTIVMPGDGTVTEYAGGFTDAMAQRRAEIRAPARAAARSEPTPRAATPGEATAERPTRAPGRLSYKDKRELDLLPEKIAALETEIAGIERAMAEPDFYARDPKSADRALRRHGEAKAELGAAEERWLELEERRTELERAKAAG